MKHLALATLTLALLSSCSTSKPPSDLAPGLPFSETQLDDSELEIRYVLGHNHHRFLARASQSGVRAQTELDREPLRAASIDPLGYRELVRRSWGFFQAQSRSLATGSCRAPFAIELRVGKETHRAKGCRTDEVAPRLARLAHEAEFLLTSGK